VIVFPEAIRREEEFFLPFLLLCGSFGEGYGVGEPLKENNFEEQLLKNSWN
jgi:hypothetical protein